MPTLVTRALLYGCSSIPSILFYTLTEKYHGTPDSILILLSLIQVLLPVAYDGAGMLADNAIWAILAVTLGAGMVFYIRDVRRCNGNVEKKRQLPPFYFVLARWNENASTPQSTSTTTTTHDDDDDDDNDQKPPSLLEMQQNSHWWLLQSVGYVLLSVPVMSFFDGLLRVCELPPDTETVSYWHRLPPPWQTLAYHLVAGFVLHLHVGIVEILYRLFLTLRLAMIGNRWFGSSSSTTKTHLAYYHDTCRFISQPAIFDKPWLSSSVYELWSVRWHQIFRPGFMKLAYQPVRALFPSKVVGRMAATMAVYLASGLLHDYILVIMMGYSTIQSYSGMLGQQTIFFLLQGIASIVSAPGTPWSRYWSSRMPNWLARLLTLVWIVYTAPIFVDPYLRIGLHKEAEVPLYPRSFDPYIGFLCPYGSISL